MISYDELGLATFCSKYRRMRIQPVLDSCLQLEGFFDFTAMWKDGGSITDSFHLRIAVPDGFPREVPIVYELGGRIPISGSFHVNRGDGSLCLGSPIRLLSEVIKKPSLTGFAETCLVPYLYAVSRKFLHGGDFVFGELEHGIAGELADYVDLFGVQTTEQARMTICCLGMKKRRANRLPCPCGCNKRLGKCHFNKRVRRFRQFAMRGWFRKVGLQMTRDNVSRSLLDNAACAALFSIG